VRPAVAAIVVFLAAGAVLLLEILAVRVMAPYVGVSLNTYTGIIGMVLAGISAGAWAGGWAADRWDPARLVGPLLIAGGVLALATAPLTTALGQHVRSDTLKAVIGLSAATVFLPAFVLSGVHPIVVKMQLRRLEVTGSVVGRLSAFATAGALVGTFGTGFFLTEHFRTRAILAAMGAVLIVVGAILWWQLLRRVKPGAVIAVLLATIVAGTAAAAVHGPCKVESAYACIQVRPEGPNQRALVLDSVHNSTVTLGKPTELDLTYTRLLGIIVDTRKPAGQPISALHIGAGAFSLPRYVAATRPGSMNTVMEIDPAVVSTAYKDFGLRNYPGLRIEEGDARILIDDESSHGYDVVIGDAFSGLSVPWQLTTKEFLEEVRRVLQPDGLYAMNLIDVHDEFLRAEAATMRSVFRNVAVFDLGGNHILMGSDAPLGLTRVALRMRGELPVRLFRGPALNSRIRDAPVLDDDFAPVDQLLNGD
jgi:MFS family permease